jgi:hypothetical protein
MPTVVPEHNIIAALGRDGALLVRLFGFERTFAIMRRHAGRALSIPTSASGRGILATLLGPAAERALVRARPGTPINIPSVTPLARAIRDAAIVEAWQRGVPGREIAERFGLARNRVYILAKRGGGARRRASKALQARGASARSSARSRRPQDAPGAA